MKLKAVLKYTGYLALFSCFFIYLFQYDKGILAYYNLKNIHNNKITEIKIIEEKILDLKQKIKSYKNNKFEQERIAREDLGMGFANELVYIIPKNYVY